MAKVLIVEDEAFIVEILTEILVDELGHEVISVNNGQEGLNKAISPSEKWDLIISDFHMPILNGGQFVVKLRAAECPSKNSPVLFVSAFSDPAREQTIGLEKIFFMEKPIIIPKLISSIEEALSS